MFKKRAYLDYASLTPIDERVLRVMYKYSSPLYANPSSIYMEGVAAKRVLEEARAQVAGAIRAHADEIFFTGGGTEANNIALLGCRAALKPDFQKPHLIVSAIEHASIMKTAEALGAAGVEVTYLPVDRSGRISLDELKRSLRPETFLVSIMTVNNEIGTVQPIRDAAKIIRRARVATAPYPLLHTDAAQALLYYDSNVERLGVDLMTLDASKMFGPRGVGALYVGRRTPIIPIMHGGGHEKGLRSGTENIPSIAGFAQAVLIAEEMRMREIARLTELKRFFLESLRSIRPDIAVNPSGSRFDDPSVQSPHILNVSIPGIDNEFFVLQLDARGIACSTKSSCLKDEDESYVLKAVGADSSASIRFSFGRETKRAQVKRAILAISELLC